MASSVRPVQQPGLTASSVLGAGEDRVHNSRSHTRDNLGSPVGSQSITVTRTLEVKPATPRSLAMNQTHPAEVQSFVRSTPSEHEPLRAASHAGHLRLPAIPHISAIDLNQPVSRGHLRSVPRPKTASGSTDLVPAPFLPPSLPPFMQSRRWARMCEPPRPKTSGHERAVSEEVRPMTLREVSFEQQRAAWKHTLPVSKVETVNENDSVVEAEGFCRPVSLPTWQLIRAARGTRGRSEPTNSLFRRLAPQRARNSTKQSRRQSVEKLPPRMSRSSQIGRKRAVSDLRQRAGMSHRRAISSHVVNLDVISSGAVIGRPSSPVPSLHDPEKAKRFSEECEALLTNKDFEKDFLSTSAEPSHSATSPSDRPKASDDREVMLDSSGAQVLEPSHLVSNNTSHPNTNNLLVSPQPPARTSSKGGARLATIVQMTKPACIPILNGFKDGSLIAPDDASEHAAPQPTSPTHQPSRIPFRMASVASTVDKPSKPPRTAKSTDTLTLIEAQIRSTPQPCLGTFPTPEAAPSLETKKPLGPSGTPPERPLPDLPAESISVGSRTPTRSSSSPSKRDSDPSPPIPAPTAQRTQFVFETMEPSQRSMTQPAAPITTTISASKPATVSAAEEQVPETPTSIYSQASLASELSGTQRYARHDKSHFRAERMNQLKRRIKADLEREHRISEERDENETERQATSAASLPRPPRSAEHEMKQRQSLDQLDQFPAVPASRPASRTSHHSGPSRRADSRTRSHARQSSRTSSRLSHRPAVPRITTRQTLGTSQIRVLVDTDPVTGHFRAGAMTPEPSPVHESNGVEASPRKSTLKTVRSSHLPTRIDEDEQATATAPRRRPSLRSIRSHASAISARHSAAGSRQSRRRPSADTITGSMIDSSDDENLLLSVSKNGRRKLRRRWNSNDVRTVQGLYDDLDEYYDTLIRQEQELQQQREEIQMMVRVLAPIGRANGLRTVMFPAEKHEFVDPGVSLDDVRSTRAPSVASTTRPTHDRPVPASTDMPCPLRTTTSSRRDKRVSKSSSRAKLDAASAALDNVIKERPVSDVSSASATTDVSRGSRASKDNSAAEGSMTDPFEYDVGPAKAAVAAAAAASTGKKHGIAIHGRTASEASAKGKSLTSSSSRPQSRGTTSVTAANAARDNVPMHRPPPVAKVIPRATLSEEEEEEREDREVTVPKPGAGAGHGGSGGGGGGGGALRSSSALSADSSSRGSSEHRLSVNHVFTRTEEMDRMLSVISSL